MKNGRVFTVVPEKKEKTVARRATPSALRRVTESTGTYTTLYSDDYITMEHDAPLERAARGVARLRAESPAPAPALAPPPPSPAPARLHIYNDIRAYS